MELKALFLSGEQAEVLTEAIDLWLEGHKDAVDQTIQDSGLTDSSQLLELTASLDEKFDVLSGIKETLCR